MEIPPGSEAELLPLAADDPASAAPTWDWGSLFDFSIAFDDSLIFPWGAPDDAQTTPVPLELSTVQPPSPLPVPEDGASRLRKRDPRLVCPNYLAGRVPCSCPEVDEKAIEEAEMADVSTAPRKRAKTGGGSNVVRCQVPGCEADISELKGYHKRHRVCLRCANASSVSLDGEDKRYCQQCGKFHVLPDFDEGKRSCRRKLERHNKRRRRKTNDANVIAEKEMEAQGDSPVDVVCDGEPMKEMRDASTCYTVETAASKIPDGDTVESEEGNGSPIASLPELKVDDLAAVYEAQKDERNTNSKSSLSSIYSAEKSAYSPMCPTGRISFKLYDWNPAEFPRRLRHQIFQWLSNMPVELEGYIRPGCTILTAFIAMPQVIWDKVSQDVTYMRDLINAPESLLLGRGTIFIYLSNTIIHVLPDGTTLTNIKMEVQAPRLHYVYPNFFEAGKPIEFVACGSNLDQPKFRFLVSFDGKYLNCESVRVSHAEFQNHGNEAEDLGSSEHEMFCIKVKHLDSEVFGPAFIEVENVAGISNFIPILLGNKDICSQLQRMEEVSAGPCHARGFIPQNVIADSSPRFCRILTSRQNAFSALLMDVAWLLKRAYAGEKEEASWSSTNVQRLTLLLKFSLQNKLLSVLEEIVHRLNNILLQTGVDKSDNWSSNVDLKLLHKYIDHARKILHQRKLDDMRSEVVPTKSISGPLMLQPSQNTNMDNGDNTNQFWNKKGEFADPPYVEAVRRLRHFEPPYDNVARDDSCSTSWESAAEHDVNVPLVTKEIIHRHRCYRNLSVKISLIDNFSNRIMKTRFPLFIAISVVLCLAACIILLHPHKAGQFAVSIRRCMFGDSPE